MTLAHSVALINNFKIHSVRFVKSIAMAYTSTHGILKKSRCGEVYLNTSTSAADEEEEEEEEEKKTLSIRNRRDYNSLHITFKVHITLRLLRQILIYFEQFLSGT